MITVINVDEICDEIIEIMSKHNLSVSDAKIILAHIDESICANSYIKKDS